jgi:DNA repair exonuclease SbcCD ATPase subunit
MINLEQIQQDINELPEEAQTLLMNFIESLKKRYSSSKNQEIKKEALEIQIEDWSDFIGCVEAEPDLSRNYKNYLSTELSEKYDYR